MSASRVATGFDRRPAEAKIIVQSDIRAKRVDLVWSYIMDLENRANPFEERRFAIGDWKARAVEEVAEGEQLLARANTLVKTGMKPLDALHVASAIEGDCAYFLTTASGGRVRPISCQIGGTMYHRGAEGEDLDT